MAFLFKALMSLTENFQWLQWGVGRSKVQDPHECGNQQRPNFLRSETFLFYRWNSTALLSFDDDCWNILPDRMIFGIT